MVMSEQPGVGFGEEATAGSYYSVLVTLGVCGFEVEDAAFIRISRGVWYVNMLANPTALKMVVGIGLVG